MPIIRRGRPNTRCPRKRPSRREKSAGKISLDAADFRAEAPPDALGDREGEPDRFLAWVELHSQADQLPDELREVFFTTLN